MLLLTGSALLEARATSLEAQEAPAAENVVLIMIDGVRWQEVFGGAEAMLLAGEDGGVGSSDTSSLRQEFWRDSAAERRRVLMPFLWGTVASEGAIYGNPDLGSHARVENPMWFSYPGYNEALAGFPDSTITSNNAPANANVTVFEWLSHRPGFGGRVAAFGTWDAFPRIFNRERAGFPIFAAWEPPFDSATAAPEEQVINGLYRSMYREWDDLAWDGLMHQAVLTWVRSHRPRALFVGFGESDVWAHGRHYDRYLRSVQTADAMIAELWHTMQSMPEYRGRTTFIITTDHGRGFGSDWTDHGREVDGADRIWLAMLGPGAPARGEVRGGSAVTQSQIASTVAALLGEDFRAAVPRARPSLPPVVARP